MLVGNGYTPGHAALALELYRSEPGVRALVGPAGARHEPAAHRRDGRRPARPGACSVAGRAAIALDRRGRATRRPPTAWSRGRGRCSRRPSSTPTCTPTGTGLAADRPRPALERAACRAAMRGRSRDHAARTPAGIGARAPAGTRRRWPEGRGLTRHDLDAAVGGPAGRTSRGSTSTRRRSPPRCSTAVPGIAELAGFRADGRLQHATPTTPPAGPPTARCGAGAARGPPSGPRFDAAATLGDRLPCTRCRGPEVAGADDLHRPAGDSPPSGRDH